VLSFLYNENCFAGPWFEHHCTIRFSKDVWDRCILNQKGRGFTDSAWRNEVIRNLHYLLIRIQTACCATDRIKATSPSIVQMRRLLHFIHVQCAVQVAYTVNEDFQGKVSFQGKMPVKLITICRLRLFVAKTQINSLKRAFICLAESRTKCLIHFIVNLRKMANLDPSMFATVVRNRFCRHSLSHQCRLSFNLVCMLVQIPKPS